MPADEAPTIVTAPSQDPVPRLSPGTHIGRYQLVDMLGHGGMGVVYRAHDPYLSRDIALKIIIGRSGAADAATFQARLLREAQALARLSHPNVVAAFDVGNHDDAVFIAMELIEGVSLPVWLDTPRSRSEVIRVLVQAGRGLAAAHAVGLLHRDFKPENVMVSRDGRVRVLDFGLARMASDRDDDALVPPEASGAEARYLEFLSVELSATGVVMGTPGYIAPEQLIRDPIDGRADQFAYAATAFYALVGRSAYPGRTIDRFRAAIMADARTPWPAGFPRRVRKVIDRGLAIRREDRFATVSGMVDALERADRRLARPLIGAGVVAAAAAALAAVAARTPDGIACATDEAAFDGAWSPARRDALSRAFATTGSLAAGDSAARIAARLDDVRRRWLAMTREACEDTHVHHRQSERVLALRTACLARERAEVGTFVGSLTSHARPPLVDRATTAVLDVGMLDDCEDAAVLVDGDERLPADPVRRAAVAAILAKLDTAHALALAGDGEGALAENRALLPEAERLDHPVTLARAHLELGEVLSVLGRRDESMTSLRAALRIAGAAQARGLVSRAATGLLHAAILADQFAEAEHILPFVQSVTDPSHASLASLSVLIDEAAIHANQFAYPEAMRVLAQAESQAAQLGDSAIAARLRIVNELAFTYDAMDDRVNAEVKFREALERTRQVHGPRHRSVLRVQENLADALSRAGRFEEALAILQETRALATGHPPESLDVISIDSVEGAVWQAKGDCVRAIPYYQTALAGLTASIGATSPHAIRTRIRIGKCFLALAQPAAAVPHFEAWLAQKVAEHASPDFQAEAGFLLAQALWQAKQRTRALATAETARARYQEAGAAFTEQTAEISSWLSARGAAPRSPR